MAIAYGNKARIPATALSTTTSAPNASYTCGTDTGVLVVMVHWGGRTARSGGNPTYNGVALTASGHGQAGVTETSTEVWFMLTPPTGSAYTINVPNSGGLTMWVYVVSFTTASGYTCEKDASNVNNTTAANPTVTVTAVVTNTMMVAAVSTGDNTFEPTARTGTSLYEEDIAAYGSAAMYYARSTTGAQALTWTEATSDDYGVIGIGFKEVVKAVDYVLQTTTGSFIWTRNNGILLWVHKMYATAGSFSWTGNDAILTKAGGLTHYLLQTTAGSFSMTGIDGRLLKNYKLRTSTAPGV